MRTPILALLSVFILGLSASALAQPSTPSKGHAVTPVTKVRATASTKAAAVSAATIAARTASSAYAGGYRPMAQAATLRPQVVVVVAPNVMVVPAAPSDSTCFAATDCHDGTQGHGAVCDRAASGMDQGAIGVCRDACRDNNDCPEGSACVNSLDPDDTSWAGCFPQ